MTTTAEKTLKTDLRNIILNPPSGIIASLQSDDNLLEWRAILDGPENTPFEGGTFILKLQFTPDYPNKAPTVWFFSRMFHPNVYKNGRICLDILEEPDKWLPSYDAAAVLCAIQSMLGDPNPNSPANGEANGLFLRDMAAYENRVRTIVRMSENHLCEGDINLNEMKNENEIGLNEEAAFEEILNELAIQDLFLTDN